MENFLDVADNLLRMDKVGDRRPYFELVSRAVGALQAVHSKTNLDIVNVESVLSALDTARILGVFPRLTEPEIGQAFDALQWVIVETLEQMMVFPTEGGYVGPTVDYAKFADLLVSLRKRSKSVASAILTFNYDIGLEVGLASKGLRFHYGLDAAGEGIPALKLHGSISWAKDAESQQVVPVPMDRYLKEYRSQGVLPQQAGKTRAPVSRQFREIFRKYYGKEVDPQPVIVPPTLSKGEYQRVLSSVWRHAAKELREASRIYILGYSLPETDQFFRLLFGLGTASDIPLREVVVMNPDLGVEPRYRKMFGPGALARFRFERQNFGDACTWLTNWLRDPLQED
jgi:hypothetical protein